MILTHIVRAYARSGYTLYTGEPRGGFASAALGVVSTSISREFLELERRIEDLLESGRISWTVSFQNDGNHRPVLVAYSGYINILRAGRTEPIAFLHALELESQSSLLACVEGIGKALSIDGIHRLHRDLNALARDGANEQELLIRLTERFETFCDPTRVAPQNRNCETPSTIVHDCAGGPAIAWLTMAAAHTHAREPWIVADELDRNGGVQTRCTPGFDRVRVLASELMFRTISAEEEVRVETPKYSGPEKPLLPQTTVRKEIRQDPLLREEATKPNFPRATRLAFAVLLLSLIFSIGAFAMSLWTRWRVPSVAGQSGAQSVSRDAVTALDASKQAVRALDGVRRSVDVLTLQSLIDAAALGDDGERTAAMHELDSRLNDPLIVNMILQRAAHIRALGQKEPMMHLTSVLLHVPAKMLSKDKDGVSALALSIVKNGPQSKKVSTDLLARLSQ